MTVRRLVAVALVLVGCWPAGVGAAGATGLPPDRAPGAAARRSDPGMLQITSVSPWVAADGDFQVRFAPSTTVPDDAVFSYTVHQRLRPQGRATLRGAVDSMLDGGPLPGVLQAPVDAPVASLGNPADGLTLDVPVRTTRGASDRLLLPTAGIHPVELRLSTPDGQELWSSVVFLNRLPDGAVTGQDGAAARMSVTLAVPIDGGPALAADGRPALDPATTRAVSDATSLLTDAPDAPLVLALRPNVVSALARSTQVGDRRFLDTVRTSTSATPARTSYVGVDTGGLVADGASDELVVQVEVGDRTVRDTTGRQPALGTWYLDDTVSPESLDLLKNLGATRIVLAADRLRPGAGVTDEQLRTSAVGLQGTAGMTATAADDRLTARLGDTSVPAAQRANQVLTSLMATWFTAAEQPATSFPGPSSVVVVPPGTDPAVLQALGPALSAGGPLSSDPGAVPRQPARHDGRTATATLAPRTAADQRGPVDQVRGSRRSIDGYRSMAPADVTDPAEWELLNSETLARSMASGQREDVHGRIAGDIARRVAAIQLPPARRVVLTSRHATIPLRFRNDLPVDVNLVLRARSVRLHIDGGQTREIVLKPGENRIDLPVTVRAPGGALLRLDLSSPDGAIALPSTSLPVTSSTISGVGTALAVISLLFLAGWWIRTARRRRRQGPDDGHPTPTPDDADHHVGTHLPEPTPASVGPGSRTPDGSAGSVGRGG